MILYIDNPKDATRKLLELSNEFGKVAGYKNTQKTLAFLYTNDEQSEREIMETLPFTSATKRIKYQGMWAASRSWKRQKKKKTELCPRASQKTCSP